MSRISPDLRVSFLGHSLKTPIMIASGAQTTVIGNIQKHIPEMAKHGWGGVVTKTVTLNKSYYVRPYFWTTPQYRLKAMQNSGSRLIFWDAQTLEKLKKDVEIAHRHGLLILGSIAGSSTQEWQELAVHMQEAGVDGIELDVSCPSEVRSTAEKMSSFFGSAEQQHAERLISDIKSVFRGPIVTKLSFHSLDIEGLAKTCERAGSSAITPINTIQGMIGIDVDTGIPISCGYKKNSYRSGVSGPIIKPFGLSAVSKVCSLTNLPVSGVGGIDDWRSAVEYMMVGATTVQICTAAMWYGFKLGEAILKGMKKFMSQHGYEYLEEFRGISLQYFTSKVPVPDSVRAFIDPKRCKKCSRCFIACRDGAFDAIQRKKDSFQVNQDICDGCGLCAQVCPEEAIRLDLVPKCD
jgi:dihydropyrimidine dehydrogenase (NAD+) subunit PreA